MTTGPAALAALLLGGCMGLPRRPAERALYVDTRKVVEVNERLGWEIDRHEIADAVPTLLPSVCQTEPEARLGLGRWLAARIVEEGGSAEARYRDNGHDLEEVRHLLRLERTRDLLEAAAEASAEDCPFWLEPDSDFPGRHGSARRFTLVLESIGGAGLVIRGDDVALGGTGGGRVLGSFGLGDRLALAVGGEVGVVAAFPEDADGNRTLVGNFAGAVPVLLRLRNSLSVVDLEAAPVFRYSGGHLRSPGARLSIGYGLSALRGGGFMPHALLWIGYEWQPPRDGNPAEHSLRLGTKVGLNWDPF